MTYSEESQNTDNWGWRVNQQLNYMKEKTKKKNKSTKTQGGNNEPAGKEGPKRNDREKRSTNYSTPYKRINRFQTKKKSKRTGRTIATTTGGQKFFIRKTIKPSYQDKKRGNTQVENGRIKNKTMLKSTHKIR